MKHTLLLLLGIIVAVIIVLVVIQLLFIRFNGSPVPIPNIPRGQQQSGEGKPLLYAIMGDSTAISQGSEYNEGFAAASVLYLSKKYAVTSINTGISGATTEEIKNDQLAEVVDFKPDVVLLAAGANDTTHFTRGEVTRQSVQAIIDALKEANPDVQIIVTASPAMDSVTRFPDGSKQLMGLRYRQVNAVFQELISKNNLIHAPIAERTRAAFIADPTLTASDNFHPNARGYALWIPVVNEALDVAIQRRAAAGSPTY
jgi:lysophospholipase L1-like esterase